MYYKDLSAYSYKLLKPIPTILNIGWLNSKNNFKQGKIQANILKKLKDIAIGNNTYNANINKIRGIMPCNLCSVRNIFIENNTSKYYLGMTEILIPSENKKHYFSAPSMIIHYIEEHNYLPDESFLKAILAIDLNMEYSGDAIFKHLLEKSRS